jgi:hypothetical protein
MLKFEANATALDKRESEAFLVFFGEQHSSSRYILGLSLGLDLGF